MTSDKSLPNIHDGYYKYRNVLLEPEQQIGELTLKGSHCRFRWGPWFRFRVSKGSTQGKWQVSDGVAVFELSAVYGIGPESREARVRLEEIDESALLRGGEVMLNMDYYENGERLGITRIAITKISKPVFPNEYDP